MLEFGLSATRKVRKLYAVADEPPSSATLFRKVIRLSRVWN